MANEKRLIDLDAYEDFKTECLMSSTPGLHSFDAGFEEGMERAAEWLDAQPTVDAVEVVHGRWEWLGPNRLVPECMCGTCSTCKVRSEYIVNTDICPNCGAKMDGDGNG